jgi:hypothetical protein
MKTSFLSLLQNMRIPAWMLMIPDLEGQKTHLPPPPSRFARFSLHLENISWQEEPTNLLTCYVAKQRQLAKI